MSGTPIKHGIYLLKRSADGGAFVITKLGEDRGWGICRLAAVNLLRDDLPQAIPPIAFCASMPFARFFSRVEPADLCFAKRATLRLQSRTCFRKSIRKDSLPVTSRRRKMSGLTTEQIKKITGELVALRKELLSNGATALNPNAEWTALRKEIALLNKKLNSDAKSKQDASEAEAI